MGQLVTSGRLLAWGVPLLAEAAALGRSVTFAWAIGPEELGRAMMLALVARLVEMASDLGIERLIVQSPDGNSSRFQAELHGAIILRAGFLALILIALAPIFATTFADGPAISTYAALALISLWRGGVHLDMRRAERRFNYKPMAIAEGGATLAMLAMVFPAVWVFGDHRAMAVVLIAHAAALAFLSHLQAERQYRLRICPKALGRIARFGAPLIANGGLMFLTFYADRMIVATAFDWTMLAIYGTVLQLALLPAQIVGRASGSLLLPRFRVALTEGSVVKAACSAMVIHFAMAGVFLVAFTIFAGPVIEFVYGSALRPELMLAALFAVAAGFRIIRTPLSQLSIALGRTGDPARANSLRAAALIPAGLAAAAGLPITALAAAAALGEVAATARAATLTLPLLAQNRFMKVAA
ncbi:MAG: oligosaccharide flippase family protein [Hyphomicrobiaceae bacterium]